MEFNEPKPTPLQDPDEFGPALDTLPVDILDIILAHLGPTDLCRVAATCQVLFDHASAEAIWAPILDQKWGALAPRESAVQISTQNPARVAETREITEGEALHAHTTPDNQPRATRPSRLIPSPSLRRYSLLELGRIDFPVQILNCEEDLGYPLSAYDARARYLGPLAGYEVRYHGPVYEDSLEAPTSLVETGVQALRLRVPPTWGECGAQEVYTGRGRGQKEGEGLDVTPGEYVEVQWRANKKMPFIWWFGEVGHFGFCPNKPLPPEMDPPPAMYSANPSSCTCLKSPCVIVEFRAYGFGFPKQRMILDTAEGGAQLRHFSHGFMGGIRKVTEKDEIRVWMAFGLMRHCDVDRHEN